MRSAVPGGARPFATSICVDEGCNGCTEMSSPCFKEDLRLYTASARCNGAPLERIRRRLAEFPTSAKEIVAMFGLPWR